MPTTLQAMRAQLTPVKHWTWCAFARDAQGNAVVPTDPRAVSFDLAGCHRHLVNAKPLPRALWQALRESAGNIYLEDFNDHPSTTHADVLALLDRAIAIEQVAK